MTEPNKIKIEQGNYVECPKFDQLITLELCENCDEGGEITDEHVECSHRLITP